MVREIDPARSKRAAAFALWMKAPMPMVTIFKTLDVTNLVKVSKKGAYKFHMLLCWCIGKAASAAEEFYTLPVGDKLMEYDRLAISTVVNTKDGDINTCDVPFSGDLETFSQDYLTLTAQVYDTCQPYDLSGDHMVIGTSALAKYEVDGVVNIYAGIYNNPFVMWGKYRKRWCKALLPTSFQFHHTQLDGVPAAKVLDDLQREINNLHR